MDKLNELLNAHILPDELNYSGQQNFSGVDLNKLKYNAFYRSYDYYMARFPSGLENLSGFPQVIESIVEKNADNSPLKEITELKSNSILDEHRDISDSPVISISE